MHYKKRSTEEYIILSICGASALCILPFVFIRAFNADWYVAFLDIFAVLATSSLFTYVFVTSKILYARWIMAILGVSIVIATVVLKGSSQVAWIYPAIIVVFFMLSPKTAAGTMFVTVLVLLMYLWNELTVVQGAQLVLTSLITIAYCYTFADRMRRQQRLLLELSTTDTLTEAGNRRAMEEKLNEIVEYRRRNLAAPAALILMDLDDFKLINDQYGHALGDEVLVQFVKLIKDRIRTTDRLYRYGGEEFIVIADNTDLDNITVLAEQLREAIDEAVFPSELHLTISVGIAEYKLGESGFDWLGRADKAMYQAKETGRNRCSIAT